MAAIEFRCPVGRFVGHQVRGGLGRVDSLAANIQHDSIRVIVAEYAQRGGRKLPMKREPKPLNRPPTATGQWGSCTRCSVSNNERSRAALWNQTT